MTGDELIESYKKTHPNSGDLHERAISVFSGEGASSFVRVLDPYRPYITHAKGSKKWDVDGNEYIDYVMGHGALLLGHSHPTIIEAVQKQIVKGVHYGDNHELEVEWAELIKRMVPSAERVELFSCGQEANLMAIRLSRIFTGRKKILRFIENFHGWADEVALPPESPGIISREVKTIPYDLKQVGIFVINETDVIPTPFKLSGFRDNGCMAARTYNNEAGHEGFPLNGSIVT